MLREILVKRLLRAVSALLLLLVRLLSEPSSLLRIADILLLVVARLLLLVETQLLDACESLLLLLTGVWCVWVAAIITVYACESYLSDWVTSEEYFGRDEWSPSLHL